MNKEMIAELNLMQIGTTQRTKTFYYIPRGGWKREIDYRPLEDTVMKTINARINNNVIMHNSSSRYLEFEFIAENHDGIDFSTEIRAAIETMFNVCEEFNLQLLSAGGNK